jgi:DNA-binding NtrC family response regulator
MERIGVLFVDDDVNLLWSMRRLMHKRPEWDVVFAHDGAHALDLMLTHDIHVVVTDISMPGMDGEQLVRRLYQEYPTVMPIVLSGAWDPVASLRHLGPYIQFLSKPVPEKDLLAAMEKAVGYARLAAA